MSTISNLEVELQVVTYVTVAFLALLVYDWIISLDREVSRIWRSDWSLVKVLYLYTRYAPLSVMTIAAEERITDTCSLMTFTTIFAGWGIGVANLILMLRTYSIYNKSRKILGIFGLSWILIAIACTIAILRFTKSFDVTVVPVGLRPPFSCFLSGESKIGLICYLALLGGESVITMLTVWKTFDSYRESGFHFSQVVSMMYCEGLFYYFSVIPFTIANVAVLLTVPPGLLLLLDSPLTVMHSILCCRLVLHIREVSGYDKDDEDEDILPVFIITDVIEPYMSSKVQQYYV